MATVTVSFNQRDGRFRATYQDGNLSITGSHYSLDIMLENLRDKVTQYKSLDFDKNHEATLEVPW